jgi:hypothetical protein
MIEKIDKIQALLNVSNVDADTETAIANMKILNLLVDLRAEAKQLILSNVSQQRELLNFLVKRNYLEADKHWTEEMLLEYNFEKKIEI